MCVNYDYVVNNLLDLYHTYLSSEQPPFINYEHNYDLAINTHSNQNYLATFQNKIYIYCI
jgi:hypothetical protein